MTVLFDFTTAGQVVPPTFGLGVLPCPTSPAEPDPFRDDARTFFCPVASADLDEQTAYSIAATVREETESYRDHLAELDREAEMASWYDAIPACG